MVCDRDGELLDQHTQFVDLAGHGLNAVSSGGICRCYPALDGGEAAAEFGDLAREIGGAARQIRDLAADIGAVAQPHRYRVVEDQEGQRGQRHDRGFHSAETCQGIQDQAEGGCDQHHADGDENRGNADHVARNAPKSLVPGRREKREKLFACDRSAPPSTAILALMLIRRASVLSPAVEPRVPEYRPWPRRGRRGAWEGRPWCPAPVDVRFPSSVLRRTAR